MGVFKISFSLIVALGFVLVETSLAQNSPQDYLKAHNAARAAVGVGPLRWDAALAGNARGQAKECMLVQSDNSYGQNLAWSIADMSGVAAVKIWVDEKRYYNYKTNSCVGGNCRHYTQVVWRRTTRVGCARVKCNSGGTFVVCNYSPRGNNVSERPY